SSFLCDFLPVAVVFVRPHALCTGRCVPARMGGCAFAGTASALQSSATPGWRGHFHFFLAKHRGSRNNGCLSAAPALRTCPENPADYPGARFTGFPAGSV